MPVQTDSPSSEPSVHIHPPNYIPPYKPLPESNHLICNLQNMSFRRWRNQNKRCAGFLCIVTKCIFMCHVCTSACADEQIAFAHRRGGIIPYPMRFLPQMHQPHCKLSRRKSLSPCSKQKNAIRFLDFLNSSLTFSSLILAKTSDNSSNAIFDNS